MTKTIEFDLYENLGEYDTAALRAMVKSINAALDPIMESCGAGLSDTEKERVILWIDEAQRMSAEVVRRESLPSAGPRAVCYEVMPDGSAVRFSTILAF